MSIQKTKKIRNQKRIKIYINIISWVFILYLSCFSGCFKLKLHYCSDANS